MKITIDVKELIQSIKNYNPDLDLSGVKAYLFDLLTGSDSNQDFVQPEAVNAQSFVAGEDIQAGDVVYKAAAQVDEPTREQAIPAYVPPKPLNSKRVVITPDHKVGKIDRDEKIKKRKELEDFTSLSGKELLARLTTTKESRPNESGQFVDDGIDDGGGGDILELG